MHETGPFSIPAIRDYVPEKLRPWIMILIVLVFQLSGGVYLASVSEMVGSLALRQEDIMMAGYASMVGMGLTFAIMFRLKFQFTSKASLLICAAVLIVCNLICMHTTNVPLLVATCFVAGIFRMWGTFECNSTIQLWLTPTRDLSVFFCYIYLLVYGCLEVTGLTTIYTAFFSTWEYMHWLVIGLLATAILVVMILFRTMRSLPKLPLFGVDWMGALLWAVTLLSVIFVCLYGEHYDWYDSEYIQAASVLGISSLLINLWRASFIRHPFIALQTWRYEIVYTTFILYMVVGLLLAPSHLLEHIYKEGVLGYDSLNTISLNWVSLLGTATGALLTYQLFALRKWRYKTMTVIGFTAIIGYLMMSYFTIDFHQTKSSMIVPIFLRSFGYVIIAIVFLTSLSRVPFHHFFHAVSVQSFVSAGFGSVLGTAILGHAFKVIMKSNSMLLGANLDNVNPLAKRLAPGELYGALQQQVLMVSMKELYGWLTLLGILCMMIFLVKVSNIRPKQAYHPTYRAIRRLFKREIKEEQEEELEQA